MRGTGTNPNAGSLVNSGASGRGGNAFHSDGSSTTTAAAASGGLFLFQGASTNVNAGNSSANSGSNGQPATIKIEQYGDV